MKQENQSMSFLKASVLNERDKQECFGAQEVIVVEQCTFVSAYYRHVTYNCLVHRLEGMWILHLFV